VTNTSRPDQWKQKYYSALDEIESNERRVEQLTSTLRNSLSRLPVAALGQHPALDKHLEKLRNLAKRTESLGEIDRLLDRVADNLKEIELRRNAGSGKMETEPASAADSNRIVSGLLVHIADIHDRKFGKSRTSAALRARSSRASAEQATSIVDEFVELLLGHDQSRTADPTETSTAVGTVETTGTTSSKELLMQLLEQLDLPDSLNRQAELLRNRIESAASDASLSPALKAIARLVSDLRKSVDKDRAEIGEFLRRLNIELAEIDKGISRTSELSAELQNSAEQFDRNMAAEIRSMRHDLDQADDLDRLKQSVSTRINIIHEHLGQFRTSGLKSHAELLSELHSMKQQFDQANSIAGKLRQELEQERARSHTDALTQLPNRLAYNERMQQEYDRWSRYGQPLSLAVIDIDFFKKINDSYGHKAGDKTLALIARSLKKHMRSSDFIARFGGEEFVVLLPNTDGSNAYTAADAVRKKIELTEFHYHGSRVPITISCGVSEFVKGDEPEQAFERADQGVYKAKQQGRNQVVLVSG